jgi:hypothetical protein
MSSQTLSYPGVTVRQLHFDDPPPPHTILHPCRVASRLRLRSRLRWCLHLHLHLMYSPPQDAHLSTHRRLPRHNSCARAKLCSDRAS